jgi:uncharacterized membrane protein YecN with MAPEG domain
MTDLHFPALTLATAGVLGLIFAFLSFRVVRQRVTGGDAYRGGTAGSGDGMPDKLFCAARAHANFAEYVPLCLILLGGLEMRYGASLLVEMLAPVLIVARIAHFVGMSMPAPNAGRIVGFMGTLTVLLVASVVNVVAVFR